MSVHISPANRTTTTPTKTIHRTINRKYILSAFVYGTCAYNTVFMPKRTCSAFHARPGKWEWFISITFSFIEMFQSASMLRTRHVLNIVCRRKQWDNSVRALAECCENIVESATVHITATSQLGLHALNVKISCYRFVSLEAFISFAFVVSVCVCVCVLLVNCCFSFSLGGVWCADWHFAVWFVDRWHGWLAYHLSIGCAAVCFVAVLKMLLPVVESLELNFVEMISDAFIYYAFASICTIKCTSDHVRACVCAFLLTQNPSFAQSEWQEWKMAAQTMPQNQLRTNKLGKITKTSADNQNEPNSSKAHVVARFLVTLTWCEQVEQNETGWKMCSTRKLVLAHKTLFLHALWPPSIESIRYNIRTAQDISSLCARGYVV